jgi:predicted esterase
MNVRSMRYLWITMYNRLIAALLLLVANKSIAQTPPQERISKQTFVYAVKDSSELGLDVYKKTTDAGDSARPCVIFLFGGAFVGGRRDDTLYTRYIDSLAANHYTVISITYRLGLKGVTHLSKFNTAPLRRAIDMAVEDVYDATAWAIMHAASLKIDTNNIILSGSSSGAITVLSADFFKRNAKPIANRLPIAFQYAGIVAFSGAILSYDGSLKYQLPPAPTLFFHGTADKIVPYNRIRFFNKGFYGSSSMANTFRKNSYPFFIYREKGLGHEVAVLPMYQNIPEILDFFDKFVKQHQKLQIDLLYNDMEAKPLLTGTADELLKRQKTSH